MAKGVKISPQTWRRLKNLLGDESGSRTHLPPRTRSASTIRIRNESGMSCMQFGVLGISGSLIDPAMHTQSFLQEPVLRGIAPVEQYTAGRFVILAEPLAHGDIGTAYAAGVCPVRLWVNDESHWNATIIENDTSGLFSADAGPVQVLWKQSGTGARWAIVRFGGSGGASIRFGEIESVSRSAFVGTFFISGTEKAGPNMPELYRQTIQRGKDVMIESGNTFAAVRFNNKWWCLGVYGEPIFDPLLCGGGEDDDFSMDDE